MLSDGEDLDDSEDTEDEEEIVNQDIPHQVCLRNYVDGSKMI